MKKPHKIKYKYKKLKYYQGLPEKGAWKYIDTYGDITYVVNGKEHREKGPAMILDRGKSKHWLINGNRHRTNGPAVLDKDFRKMYYINDVLHRYGRPAIVYNDSWRQNEWWWDGHHCRSERTYWKRVYKAKKITKEELFLKMLVLEKQSTN